MRHLGIVSSVVVSLLAFTSFGQTSHKGSFVHPGMWHSREDLNRMRQEVEDGRRSAPKASLDFAPQPFTHVIRGAYGRPNIGGRALGDSADAAYNHALQWVISGEKAHAEKAVLILNAWSPVLWGFDDNDAKLLAGWTGHKLCNAAEILRYTHAGWQEQDIDQFERMLRTVYYPLIADFFPEANGNWDAALMHTMLCIGIFCDDRDIFDRAVHHFLRGPGNGGITKYIYPSGQCQENTRDQAHTQLGLGELAGACRVAWTQGVDLYGAANNRLALGIEYTAKFMLGEDVPSYGTISRNGRGRFRDIYEDVYVHYRDHKGLDMPSTKRAAQRSRRTSGVDLDGPAGSVLKGPPQPSPIAELAGARLVSTADIPDDAIRVRTGQSIQEALDSSPAGGWVFLEKGLHTLPATVRIPSDITIAGGGIDTVLFLDPEEEGAALVNSDPDIRNVTIRDLVVEGATTAKPSRDPNQDRRQRSYQMAPSRAGIAFSADRAGQMSGLRLEYVTVRNCTHNGVAIRGARDVVVTRCDFSDNGSSVVPGPGLHHNLLITRSRACAVQGSRLDTSPWGCGIELSHSRNVTLTDNETARNALNGIRVTESEQVSVVSNLAEGNDRSGIRFLAQMDGSRGVEIRDNLSRNNAGYGIEISQVTEATIENNRTLDNGHTDQTVLGIDGEKFLINGVPTYLGRSWNGFPIEGLLMNARMVQGIFDDLNPETADRWAYEDTKMWDPDRNTDEFVAAMDSWRAHGLLAFTINLQGGSPLGYGNKGWINSAYDPKGELRPAYMARLARIMDKANEIGMVPILGLFYNDQEDLLEDEAAVLHAVDQVVDWLFARDYRHVLIEINNECNLKYRHAILQPERVHEVIQHIQARRESGYRYLVSTSYSGRQIPRENVVAAADFLLLHGNGVKDPAMIPEMVRKTKAVKGYTPKPILFNEDDHFDFDKPVNHLVLAVQSYASWGLFDYRKKNERYENGFQSVPVDWTISSDRKKGFFAKLREITGGFE